MYPYQILGLEISDLPVMGCGPGTGGGSLQFTNCTIFVGVNLKMIKGDHQQPTLLLATHPPRPLLGFLEAIHNCV